MTRHRRLVDLSHPIESGMAVYPGLPSPRIEPHISHAASRSAYGGSAEFEITRVFAVGSTATYLDSPYHRFPAMPDLASLPLERLAGLPAFVVHTAWDVGSSVRAIEHELPADIADHAVLFRTGWDRWWGRDAYWEPAPFVPHHLATQLVAAGVALVGIDTWNVDDPIDPVRPAHTVLLGAGIPIVEHLTGLVALPPRGAVFTAVPAPIRHGASFPVRAFAELPAGEHGGI